MTVVHSPLIPEEPDSDAPSSFVGLIGLSPGPDPDPDPETFLPPKTLPGLGARPNLLPGLSGKPDGVLGREGWVENPLDILDGLGEGGGGGPVPVNLCCRRTREKIAWDREEVEFISVLLVCLMAEPDARFLSSSAKHQGSVRY